jgi:RNA polymerase sigma-70 factor (ECF subfamily)
MSLTTGTSPGLTRSPKGGDSGGPCLGGDVDLDRLYRDTAPAVLGYLRASGTPDPDNVLGEVYLAVVRGIGRFEGDERLLRSWVFSIARNRAVDAHRKQGRRLQLLRTEPPPAPEPAPDVPDPELIAALGTLTDDQREVVLLRFVADLPLADVAALLGRSVDGVKKLQRRGLDSLRRNLGGTSGSVTP